MPNARFLPLSLGLSCSLALLACDSTPTAAPSDAAPPAAATTVQADAAPPPAPVEASLPLDPKIRSGVLENGLRYFIRQNAEPKTRAELRLVVNAGSVLEEEHERGGAHFVEHMAFNGSTHFAKNELVAYFESIGMRFGADLNAYTNFDETVYMLTLPTDDEAILEKGFLILEDWAGGITFDPNEVNKERGVVIEERRARRSVFSRIMDEQLPVVLNGSKYADRLPIGKLHTLEKMDAAVLKGFYQKWYRPDLMAVVAVGDFNVDQVEAKIKAHFGKLAKPQTPTPNTRPAVPHHEDTRFLALDDEELPIAMVGLTLKEEAKRLDRESDYRQGLMDRLFNDMCNLRLAEVSKKPTSPFMNASISSSARLVRTASAHNMFAIVKPESGQGKLAFNGLLTEVERIRRFGFVPTELERAKSKLLKQTEHALKESKKSNSARYAAEYTRHFLVGESAPGIEMEYQLTQKHLPAISLQELNALAAQRLRPQNRVVVVAGPKPDLLSEADARQVLAQSSQLKLSPYVDQSSQEPWLATAPTPGEIVERKELKELGVLEWTLSNGVRVLLKPTDFKDDQVMMSAYSPGGHSLVKDKDYLSASMAPMVLGASGLGNFSAIDLQKRLSAHKIRVYPSITEDGEHLDGSASPEDLELLFQLSYLYFTAPRLDEEAVSVQLGNMATFLERQSSMPEMAFGQRFQEMQANGQHRRMPMTAERLKQVDPKRAIELYRERMANLGDLTITFVGAFQPEAMEPFVRTYLASLPTTGKKEKAKDLRLSLPKGTKNEVLEKGQENKAQVQILMHSKMKWSRQQSLALNSLIDIVRVRLRNSLREEKGATYGVGIRASLPRKKRASDLSINIQFGCDPARKDESLETLWAVLDEVRKKGVTEEELANAKKTALRELEQDQRSNHYWTFGLERVYRYEDDPKILLNQKEKIEAVSAKDVHSLAKKVLKKKNLLQLVLLPAKTPAAATPAPSNPQQ